MPRNVNFNWFKASLPNPSLGVSTEFEQRLRLLDLTTETCVESRELRQWCERNKERVYIPEWLLKKWGMSVDADLSGAA